MRDPNRIDYYCNELSELWHKVPDLRFTQFMESITDAWNADPMGQCHSFYAEDEEFFKFMREYLKEIKNT